MKTILVKKASTNPSERKKCLYCGNTIPTNRKNSEFCCISCYKAYYGETHNFISNKNEFLRNRIIMDSVPEYINRK